MPESTTDIKKMTLNIGLDAKAEVSAEVINKEKDAVDDIEINIQPSNIFLSVDLKLAYSTLSSFLQYSIKQKRIRANAPFFNLDIQIFKIQITGNEGGVLNGEAQFSGTHTGIIYFSGKPILNADKNELIIEDVYHRIKTGSVLIKLGKWLFQNKIESELKKLTAINLLPFYQKAIVKVEESLNKRWNQTISSVGKIQTIKVKGLAVLPNVITVNLLLEGNMQLTLEVPEIGEQITGDNHANS